MTTETPKLELVEWAPMLVIGLELEAEHQAEHQADPTPPHGITRPVIA